jgi:hypothetical protein
MDDRAQSPAHHIIGTPESASASDREAVPIEPGDILVSEATAAAILDVPPRTLQWWRLTHTGPPFVRLTARVIRYRRADLAQWVNARVQDTPRLGAATDPNTTDRGRARDRGRRSCSRAERT